MSEAAILPFPSKLRLVRPAHWLDVAREIVLSQADPKPFRYVEAEDAILCMDTGRFLNRDRVGAKLDDWTALRAELLRTGRATAAEDAAVILKAWLDLYEACPLGWLDRDREPPPEAA